jgi:RNA polymerase sigma factor (sigma-70 family)
VKKGLEIISEKPSIIIDSERAFEKYKPLIRSVINKYNCRNYGIEDDDLLQEVRIRLWKACKHEIDYRRISSYIRKIVDSVIINHLNNARKEMTILNHTETLFSDFHSPEIERVVMECVETLLESRRMVVIMYLNGFTLSDIAYSLRWSKTKTYNLYIRGIRNLRAKLKDRGIYYEIK